VKLFYSSIYLTKKFVKFYEIFVKYTGINQFHTQRARKFEKVQAKKKTREIASLAVLKNFPVQKLIFGHF